MASASQTNWYTVNTRLLPVKLTYFLFGGASGDLLPFITIYMKQLGLSSTETGIIYGIMPFISFIVGPLFGALADKTKQHKLVLILCVLMTGLFYGLLLVTPAKARGLRATDGIPASIKCGQADSFVRGCEIKQKNGADINNEQHCNNELYWLSQHYNMVYKHVDCEAACTASVAEDSRIHVCFIRDTGNSKRNSCVYHWNNSLIWPEINSKINSFTRILDNQVITDANTSPNHTCYNYVLNNISYINLSNWQLLCTSNVTLDCFLHYGLDNYTMKFLNETFLMFFVIYLFCNIFYSPVISLINAIAYDILGDKRDDWGRQRNWGTLGYTIFAVTSTYIMDALSKSKKQIDYSISFYIFVGLSVVSSVVIYFVQISKTFLCNKMLNNLRELLKYPEIVSFLIVVTFFGILNCVIEAFLFWFLKDLGSSQIILGLALMCNCIPMIIILFFAGRIIKKIGEVGCLYLAAAALAIRLFAYSFLTNAWYVLPVEVLHCLTFGLFFAAASAYGSKITPLGMSGTIQGLICGLYYGFGKGIGGLITGKLIEPETGLGARWTFRLYGFVALFLLMGYATIQTVFFKKNRKSPGKVPTVKEAKDEEAVDAVSLENNQANNELRDVLERE